MSTAAYHRDYYERVTKPARQAASTSRRQARLGPDARVALTIRLPGALLDQLRAHAAENRRSLAAEIVARLSERAEVGVDGVLPVVGHGAEAE